MKTTKIETKTFYTVELDSTDLMESCAKWRELVEADDVAIAGMEPAFSFIDKGITVGSVYKAIDSWVVTGDAATCTWLAKDLGFDGCSFCGVTVKRSKSVRFTFYNYGGCI